MKDFIKIFAILTPSQLKQCYMLIALMLIGAVLESVGIGSILPLISIIGQEDFLQDHEDIVVLLNGIGVTTHGDFIVCASLLLIILYILKNIYIGVEIYIQRTFARKNQIKYSEKLFELYINKPYLFHVSNNTSLLLRNVNQGGSYVFNGLIMPVFLLLTELITAFMIWLMLVFVDAFTAVIVAGIMAIMMYFIIRSLRKQIYLQGIRQNDASAEFLKWINQGIGAVKETKILQRESFFVNEFRKEYEKYALAVQKIYLLSDCPRLIIEVLVVSGLLLLIIFKTLIGENPQTIVPLLGVLALAAFRLMPSANRIIGYYNGIKSWIPFFDEIYPDLINVKKMLLTHEKQVSDIMSPEITFRSQISINNLSFRYPDSDNAIFREVSFTIPKGTFVGIVGPSGAGKTTFVDTFLGLLEPSTGEILCDNENIYNNISEWQSMLAYVPQDIYLIDGTIGENIALGVSLGEIDEILLARVLRMSELMDFINSLPQGLNTLVGERGVKLSGGQRQRIGIARALYRDPKILVLDEATSALDNQTEKSITDTILKLKGKITIISIAHRVSTLDQCDFKVKLENGHSNILY
ncbi:ABC transporter ATP-binding protein [Selenomonas sp. FC4001]|uniref:ABC transporter ATP-binding protein n=1 Tax=Selenomonas sp. FC4001 TaxID=1408313 RepID=UPI000562DE9C|nr:ABC transporter ATP-binding protein [Selenomonas sp. FC4001]